MSEMDDIEAKLMEALKRAYRIGYDDAVAKLQPALANLESMLAETRITEPARHMESFKAMAPKLIAAWNDFTSQEMYGEAIREPGSCKDFADWEELHCELIALLDEVRDVS